MTGLFSVQIDERCQKRLKQGYPWVFRSEVLNAKKAESLAPGSVVDFVRAKGDFVARGFYNPKPQLVGRVLTLTEKQPIEKFFIFHQIESALRFREKLFAEPFYRLIHAEGDGLPGLVIDRYGDVVVCQVNTAGMEALFPHVEAALKAFVEPKAIVLRNDTSAREQEGLTQEQKVVFGTLENPVVTITENGAQFQADVMTGQKTGWFFDQRDNRDWVASLAKDSAMLDVFCHSGGFGIQAAKAGATAVTFVDSSGPALQAAEKNALLNGVEKKCQFIEGKAFETMEKLRDMGQKFGLVSLDPPAFIKSRKDMAAGLKGYQKLAKLAAPLIESSGYLFIASCSHHADLKELTDHVAEGLATSGRSFQLIKTAGAAPDHPVHPFLPETGYLKALTFRFLD